METAKTSVATSVRSRSAHLLCCWSVSVQLTFFPPLVVQDVKTLKFTRNPAEIPQSDADHGRRHARFICPLTLREMSGQVPFVYITTCGDVFSAAGLRTVATSAPSSSTPSPPAEGDEKKPTPALDLCPQCGTKFNKTKDVRSINPPPEEALKMRDAMLTARAAAKAAKASKKRKADDSAASGIAADGSESTKKSKKEKGDASDSLSLPAPSTNSSFAHVNKKVAQELAEEEKKRKSTMSSAVASLYQSKKDNKSAKETFLTMNTFTRVCSSSPLFSAARCTRLIFPTFSVLLCSVLLLASVCMMHMWVDSVR